MNNFFKSAFLLTLCLFSFSSFSQLVYDNNQNGTLVVDLLTGGGSYSFNIREEKSTSSSKNRTHLLYLPLASGSGSSDNRKFSYHANRDHLPDLSSGTITSGQNLLRFILYMSVVGNYNHLNVGISADSAPTSFQVIGTFGFPTYTTGAHYVDVDLKKVCEYSPSSVFNCSTFSSPNNDEFSLFFFLATTNMSNGSSVNSADYSGVIYRVKASNRIQDSAFPHLTNLTKGDSQLAGSVNGVTITQDFYSWYSYATSSTCTDTATNETLSALGISYSDLGYLANQSLNTVLRVNKLTNGTCYSTRFFECDKYGFCSYSTEQMSGTPETIEALLKKQACFFFTAGFNGEHYIVTYFQAWRDHFLRRFWLGRKFIHWYYNTAPQYTPYILERPWLQKVIRAVGYLLYGLIRGWWIISLVVLSSLIFLFRRAIVQSHRLKS